MMTDLFNPDVTCKQFQVSQRDVSHVEYGPSEIIHIEVSHGIIYYIIKVIDSGLKIKCGGSKLTSEVTP
jgi:hypothetical protein